MLMCTFALNAGSLPVIHPCKPLQQELLRLLLTAPFWNKDLEWLQSRAAVQALLPKAATGQDFARLLWLIEELLYEDLLKGSGWGRRRGWFRDQREATRNIAQVYLLPALPASPIYNKLLQLL